MESRKRLLGGLFDLSFEEFITIRVVKILYVISMFLVGIGVVVLIVQGFRESVALGIGFLVFSPVIYILYLIVVRVSMETLVVIFKIAENLQRLTDRSSSE